jgi:hypothetical protein
MQIAAKCPSGLERRNNKDGSLNSKHADLFKQCLGFRPSGQSPDVGCSKGQRDQEIRCSLRL